MTRRLFTLLSVWAAALLFIGCSGGGPTVDYDPDFDPSRLNRFGVMKAPGSRVDPLDAQRIESAVAGNLTAKGYRHDDPVDFVARYSVTVLKDVPSNLSFGFGLGSWGHNGGASVGTSVTPSVDKMAISIDMVDPQSDRVFWSASENETMPDFKTPEDRRRFFNAVVYRLLKNYPRHKENSR